MKKIIIGLSGLVLAVLVIILFVNAQNGPKEDKKVSTEISKSCGKCPSTASCRMMAETKKSEAKACCDKARCKEMGCDRVKCQSKCSDTKCEMKKCDQANCRAKCSDASCEMKKCDPAACNSSIEK